MLAFPPAFRYNGKAGIVPAARPKRPGGALNHIVRCKRQMAEFKYEITERIAVLSQSPNGWERQLNMVSWNGFAIQIFSPPPLLPVFMARVNAAL